MDDKVVITVASRYFKSLIETTETPIGEVVWANTYLKVPYGGKWLNIITNETIEGGDKIPLGQILNNFSTALLTKL